MRYSGHMQQTDDMPVALLVGNEFRIQALGRSWSLKRDLDLEEAWNALGQADFTDERIPYWTELWPASLVLTHWLGQSRESIRGRLCLDIGCGLGLTAIIGQWLGARIVACDYELESLEAASRNARNNGVPEPAWICMDWRKPALNPGAYDFAWGGDILYEKRACEPLLALIDQSLKQEGRCWLADPGRGVFHYFEELAKARGFALKKSMSKKAQATRPQDMGIKVTIWEMRRQAA